MLKQRHKTTDTGKEAYIDLVHPQTKQVIPTVERVAKRLLDEGWKKADQRVLLKGDGSGKPLPAIEEGAITLRTAEPETKKK